MFVANAIACVVKLWRTDIPIIPRVENLSDKLCTLVAILARENLLPCACRSAKFFDEPDKSSPFFKSLRELTVSFTPFFELFVVKLHLNNTFVNITHELTTSFSGFLLLFKNFYVKINLMKKR